jgi:hypothetical protein
MFSERKQDGIERAAEQYFKRWNAKAPERGGCQKGNIASTPTVRKAELVKLRERFAKLQNRHLAKHGHAATVTHLSLKAQGIDREPEPHLGPKVAAAVAKDVQELRAGPTPEPAKPKDGGRDPLSVFMHLQNAMKQSMAEAREAYSIADRAYWDATYHVEACNRKQGFAKQAIELHPPQPKLLGRKEWAEKLAVLKAKYEATRKDTQAAKEAVKKAEDVREKASRHRNLASQEKPYLELIQANRPELVPLYHEGKKQAKEIAEKKVKENERTRQRDDERGPSR